MHGAPLSGMWHPVRSEAGEAQDRPSARAGQTRLNATGRNACTRELAQAAVFLQFLWDDRTQNPRPWDTVRRAFNGIQPEALSAIPSFECASAKPLEALEQRFRAYCQQQTQGLILSRQRRYGALTRAPERFN